MKIIKLEQAELHNNSDKCKVIEYGFNDKDIDCATAEINGRYPDTGYCVNEECKELIYVVDGKGTLNKKDQVIEFKKGDAILIDKGEIYYWNAQCTIVMPCTPAWYPEQHKLIEENNNFIRNIEIHKNGEILNMKFRGEKRNEHIE